LFIELFEEAIVDEFVILELQLISLVSENSTERVPDISDHPAWSFTELAQRPSAVFLFELIEALSFVCLPKPHSGGPGIIVVCLMFDERFSRSLMRNVIHDIRCCL
jgi:hypothetical protein